MVWVPASSQIVTSEALAKLAGCVFVRYQPVAARNALILHQMQAYRTTEAFPNAILIDEKTPDVAARPFDNGALVSDSLAAYSKA
jgi:hypothetical protein